jgi:hypothetical protein
LETAVTNCCISQMRKLSAERSDSRLELMVELGEELWFLCYSHCYSFLCELSTTSAHVPLLGWIDGTISGQF